MSAKELKVVDRVQLSEVNFGVFLRKVLAYMSEGYVIDFDTVKTYPKIVGTYPQAFALCSMVKFGEVSNTEDKLQLTVQETETTFGEKLLQSAQEMDAIIKGDLEPANVTIVEEPENKSEEVVDTKEVLQDTTTTETKKTSKKK